MQHQRLNKSWFDKHFGTSLYLTKSQFTDMLFSVLRNWLDNVQSEDIFCMS